ncbi:MAG: phosphoenolpyruvate carboxylase [Gammaproteobacteria bacterium]|nr:phosphoenolpyruvate carboxylase [Gammaproteobacteria bacterium]
MLTRRFVQAIRFFSVAKDENLIQRFFKKLTPSLNHKLKEQILLNHVEDAKLLQTQVSRLAAHDASIPKNWPLKHKLVYAKWMRETFPPRPVLTSHPTEVLSEEMRHAINQLVKDVLAYDSQIEPHPQFAAQIEEQLEKIKSMSWLPKANLTPENEMQRQDDLYLTMMSSWPKFNQKNIAAFAEAHNCKEEDIQVGLTRANQQLYRHVSSWVVADIDGNKKRNRATMETMESSLQSSVIQRYILRLEPLLVHIPQLKSAYNYLNRCQQSIAHHIYFNLKGAEIAKKRLLYVFDKAILQPGLSEDIKAQLSALRDLVDLMGFRGDLKQFVRQSSKANAAVFQEMVNFLVRDYAEIKMLADDEKHYAQWSLPKKSKLHDFLRNDSKYFDTLKKMLPHFSADSHRELDILSFVTEYQDQFSYILSDTENTISLNEVIILFGFSAYRRHQLYIDDIRMPPVNLVPLCETPEDLVNLEHILDAMLSNPYLKEVIIKNGEIIYVAGPSDLGKSGGLFAHIDLIEAEKNANRILAKHQAFDPQLQMVQLRVLYGLGGDFHRRVSQSFSQLFCTFQGSDACALGAYGRFPAYVHQVATYPSENAMRAQQLSEFEIQDPQNYQLMKVAIKHAIKGYQRFIHHPASQELFRQLTIPAHLGALTNTSSRAESKGALPKDIIESRAIGIANYDIASLVMMRILMSADGLIDFPMGIKENFGAMYQGSIVVKEQVMKLMFSIAISDYDRAWLRVTGTMPTLEQIEQWAQEFLKVEVDKKPYHALAYMVYRAPQILHTLSFFLPLAQKEALDNINTELYKNPHRLSEMVLKAIHEIGQFDKDYLDLAQEIEKDLLPRYQRLAKAMDDYDKRPQDLKSEALAELEENVVLALRGDRRITAGPKSISNMRLDSKFYQMDFIDEMAKGLTH